MKKAAADDGRVVDTLTLRFVGEDGQGQPLHELRAAHVAEVLQGVVELHSDFAKAGAFGGAPPSDVLVTPAQEGSFIIEVLQLVEEYPTTANATFATLGTVIYQSTKSLRAEPSGAEYLENGNVLVSWTDGSANEVPREVWTELNKRKRRRKKQLRKLLAPLSDRDVAALEVSDNDHPPAQPETAAPDTYTLDIEDYRAAEPEEEIEETSTVFSIEAQMSAIDFEDPEKWRVRVKGQSARTVIMEDEDFLLRVDRGLAIHKRDIFNLRVREDLVVKNGRARRKWTILEVTGQRRSVGDDDS